MEETQRGSDTAATKKHYEQLLNQLPYGPSFRFIDEIITLNDTHIVSKYRFRPEAFFYKDHFPGDPVTPGVILLETMAQTALVVMGMHLEGSTQKKEAQKRALFTAAEVTFNTIVYPSEEVLIYGEKIFCRLGAIKSKARIVNAKGVEVCSAIIRGQFVDAPKK